MAEFGVGGAVGIFKTNAKVSEIIKKSSKFGFVIMPFGGWYDEYYSEIYAPAIGDCNLKPIRADSLYRSSPIINDIWECTLNAEIILADLTGKNPNVFYELGLAHVIAKPTVLVTQSIEDVPFDLRGLRIIQYDQNKPDWGSKLKEDIIKSSQREEWI